MAVIEEQQRRVQEAMASKPAPSEENLEMKAFKAMGAMEDGDAVFGSGAEVSLDSQVLFLDHIYNFHSLWNRTIISLSMILRILNSFLDRSCH
jgi:hypothetical protein